MGDNPLGIPRLKHEIVALDHRLASLTSRSDSRNVAEKSEEKMPTRRALSHLLAGTALACALVSLAWAAETPRHVRGTIASLRDSALTIEKTRGGSETITVSDGTGIFLVKETTLAAIKPNQFVGITSVDENGKQVAREVHVFADDLRGLGEGHYPWDMEGNPNMMTNANIAKVETVGGDRVLRLNYAGGEQMISVPDNAAVVSFEKTTADQLAPGRKVFIIMKPQAEGPLAAAVVVGANGVKPPM